MINVAVTGANGYIGSHVIKVLQKSPEVGNVTAIDFRSDYIDDGVRFLKADILAEADAADLYSRLGCPDAVIHLAWQDSFNHAAPSHLNNLGAHYVFLKNLIDAGCPSVSVMGTMHEVGYWEGEVTADTPCSPLSLYGIAKNALRQALLTYCEDKDVSIKWLRAFYLIGDDAHNKSIFAKILKMASEGQKTFPFTDGKNKYDFEDINILAKQIAKASIQNDINGIINCCSGVPVALKDKVEEFIKQHGLSITPEYGMFPVRKYDSPAIWGNADLINKIMSM